MKNIRIMLAALGIVLGVSVPALVAVSSAAAANPCVVVPAKHFTVNADKTITGDFAVTGDAGCTQPVTMMTWVADSTLFPNNNFYTSQTVNDEVTQTFGVGEHTLTAKLPMCSTDPNIVHSYQADIIAGANPPGFVTPPGTPGFYWTAQANGQFVVVDYKIAPGTCPAPVTIPVTPAVVTTTTPAQPQPTALVNTGPGNIAELFAVVTVGGALAHRTLVRKVLKRS